MVSTDSTDTDEVLLSRFVRGERAALGLLAHRYEATLLGLAQGLVGGRSDLARDAVQDCWVRVIRYGKGFGGHSSLRTWLYRIVINRCRDLQAEHAKRNGVSPQLTDVGPVGVGVGEGRDRFAEHQEDRALAHALDGLPGQTRLLLLLCYHHGLTHQQAAEVLEIPIGTLKSRLHAALESLRLTLAPGRIP